MLNNPPCVSVKKSTFSEKYCREIWYIFNVVRFHRTFWSLQKLRGNCHRAFSLKVDVEKDLSTNFHEKGPFFKRVNF